MPFTPTTSILPRALRATVMACLGLTALFSADLRAQVTVGDLSVTEATIGTEFTIAGTGFGEKRPKVSLSTDGEAVKKTKLKVLESTDTLITVEVKKALAGTYRVLVTVKGEEPAESTASLTVEPPRVVALDAGFVTPGDEASMTVSYATSKPKVVVAGKKGKVVSIEPVKGKGDLSTVVFRVPKVANGEWAVMVANKVGGTFSEAGLAVGGSTVKLGKPGVSAAVVGSKPIKATPEVSSSVDGPTTVVASKASKKGGSILTLTLPFVFGRDAAPQVYTESPASIHWEDTLTGEEFLSMDGAFDIRVSAMQGSLIAGSFSGTLDSVTEGAAPREVMGAFVYDGMFELTQTPGTTNTVLAPDEIPPTLAVQALSVTGASGPFGNFVPGDEMSVTFRVAKEDGTLWRLSEFSRGRAMISGPTTNYQRVVTMQTDVRSAAEDNGDGTYTYTFPPIPEVYEAPYNDTEAFDEDDGELTGQDLLPGTYTAAIWFEWTYTVTGSDFGQVGTRLIDFPLGEEAVEVEPRQVVTTENCNQCHGELEFHGGHRKMNDTCVLCHTAGAEDRNVPEAAGGTPGVSIEMSVMVHRIHNGAHLPSVLGVTTDAMGNRDYTADPQPYQLVGFGNSIHDYSEVEFPAWPNLTNPMPRDTGYSDKATTDEERDLEDAIRSGVTSCYLCHGDPDGDEGPLAAPAQGDFAYTVQRRNTCGSCHDDWVFDQLYRSNEQVMPAQTDDNGCTQCHISDVAGPNLDAFDAHTHPLLDPAFATGVNFGLMGVSTPDRGSGNIEVGDRVAVSFTITDDLGAPIDASELDRLRVMISGPTWNLNAITPEMDVPPEVLSGPQPYSLMVPERVYYEVAGTATGGDDEFTTSRAPHWNAGGQDTEVFEVTGVAGGSSTATTAVTTPVNFIDVGDATGFERDDFIVLDLGGGGEEYLQIQSVIGNRLWFSSPYTQGYAPGPVNDHAMGVTVEEVTTNAAAFVQPDDYTVDEATGTISEVGGAFTDGATILTTYTTEWVVPDTYPLALNAEPDLDETAGGWAGKSLVEGTYMVGLWGHISRSLEQFSETNSYRDPAEGQRLEFAIGSSVSVLEPYDNITGLDNCYACHVDITFHGNGRTGFDACILCHGTSAAGDRPQYVAPNAPETEGVTVSFREMLHKIHAGADLHEAEEYTVVGFGQGYPDNFSTHTYENVHFPAMPSGTQNCATCHGAASVAWTEPEAREHPTEQGLAVTEWSVVCGSCHDSPETEAHISTQVSPSTGNESCLTCHGEGQTWNVDLVHRVR